MTYHRGTAQQFEDWHNPIAEEKGYPTIGRNAKTGLPAPDKCGTTAYSKKIAHPINKEDYVWVFGEYEDKSKPEKQRLLTLTEQEKIDAGWKGRLT